MVTSKRLKVKLFFSDERVSLADAQVSEWIETNPNIEIQDVKVTGAGAEYTRFLISITYLE
jgi:hypothetical protein